MPKNSNFLIKIKDKQLQLLAARTVIERFIKQKH